eukprot:765455-Hanusia_phi.AAC.4
MLAAGEDDELIATCADDGLARVWRLTAEQKLTRVKSLRGHAAGVHCVCFSPDRSLLATGSNDSSRFPIPTCSPADACPGLKLWSSQTWKCLVTVLGHASCVHAVAFDAFGHKLVSSSEDNSLRVWLLPGGAGDSRVSETLRIRKLKSRVLAVDFTSCGKRLVAVMAGREVQVWHALKGTLLHLWEFSPFFEQVEDRPRWRTAALSLTRSLNALIVTDTAGLCLSYSMCCLIESYRPSDSSAASASTRILLPTT